MEIRTGTRRFPCRVIENPGTGNNCLGYALGSMLKARPSELRRALVHYFESVQQDQELSESFACSVLEDFESVPEAERVNCAIARLKANSFIPADLFVSYCQSGPWRRKMLERRNVVFFAERDGYYEPVTYYLDDVSRPTHYIGCDNTHYEALSMSVRHQLQFDVEFFGL